MQNTGKWYLSLLQFGPIRFDVVHDAVIGSRKCDSSNQQDDEDHVGEGRCEVHNLKHTQRNMYVYCVFNMYVSKVHVTTKVCLPKSQKNILKKRRLKTATSGLKNRL